MIMPIFQCMMFFLAVNVFAQSTGLIMEEKLRPLIFQAEQQLDQQIKQSVRESSGLKDFFVKTKLNVNVNKIANRSGLNTSSARLQLPGLDDTANPIQANANQFRPVLYDVFYAAQSMDVTINSEREFSESEKKSLKAAVKSAVQTLQLQKLSVNFIKVSGGIPVTPEKVEKQQTQPKQDFTPFYWMAILFLGGFSLLCLVMFLIAKKGMRKMEEFTRTLVNSLSTIEVNLPERSGLISPSHGVNTNQSTVASNVEVLDDLKKQIGLSLEKYGPNLKPLFDAFFSIKSMEKSFLLLDCLPEKQRVLARSFLPADSNDEYNKFLSDLSDGLIDDKKLLVSAKELIKEISLFSHDPSLLKKSILKNRLNGFTPSDILRLVEDFDASEFGHLIQLLDPLMMTAVLTSSPQILNKFDKIPKNKFNLENVESLLAKVDSFSRHSLAQDFHQALADYLPEDLEKILNQKFGIPTTSWSRLDARGEKFLMEYALLLKVDELSAFMAIIPTELQAQIWQQLPELKANRVKNRGIQINQKSFEMKHDFLKQVKNLQ